MADEGMRVGYVMLGVTDLAKSLEFYQGKLGLTVQQQFGGFAFLDGGGVTLALNTDLAKVSPQVAGATEIVLSVPHVRAAYDALKEKGVPFVNEPRVVTGTSLAANFSDPDGHKFSIFGPE